MKAMNLLSALFGYRRSTPDRRRQTTRKNRTGSTELRLQRLEDRALLSGNVISGFVFHDANNNGLFDPGESPLANSRIELHNAQGTTIGTAVTDATGYY